VETVHRGLSKRSIGAVGLVSLGISASCPMAVVAGAFVATFAVTGVVEIAPSFLLLGVALAAFAVGFLAMSRDIPHAASFYAFLAHGLGPSAGVAGAAVSLLSYNVVQVSLYGLLGAVAAGVFGGPWWMWAFVAWLAIGLLGVLHIGVNTWLLTGILVLELAVILLLDVTGLHFPAGGQLDPGPLLPTNLVMSGALGGVLAFTVSAFIGFETVAVYREEAASHRSVKVACYATIGFLAVFYALSSWALASAVGPAQIIDTARDPAANLPFSILGERFGPLVQNIGQALLITGLVAALLSFHSVVARYVYALAREGVLPANLGTLGGAHGGVPIAGSVAQTSIAAIGIAVFAIAGADPIATLFTWLSELSALGILALMIFTSIAVLRYYRKQGRTLGWSLGATPVISAVALSAILAVNIANMDSILNTEITALRWVLPAIVVLVALLGVAIAGRIRQRRPSAYLKIGRGQPRPLAVPERVLARLEM
jgi:amino acid transporter